MHENLKYLKKMCSHKKEERLTHSQYTSVFPKTSTNRATDWKTQNLLLRT